MTPEQLFLRAIAENPDDDAPRLMFADWLAEHDDPARGEFIRLQCEIAQLPEGDPQRKALERRAKTLHDANLTRWLGPLHEFDPSPSYERGTACLYLTAGRFASARFQKVAAEWFPHAGVVQLILTGTTKRIEAVAKSSLLDGIHHLMFFRNGLRDAGLKTLVASPHLLNVTDLGFFSNPIEQGLRYVAASKRLPKLRRLTVSRAFITASVVRPLLAAAKTLPNLTDLRINEAGFDDRDIAQLAGYPEVSRLHQLDLAQNDIGDRGAEALASSRHLRDLQRLQLYGNNLTDTGALALAESRHLRKLRLLDVRGNRITAAGMQMLQKRFGDAIVEK